MRPTGGPFARSREDQSFDASTRNGRCFFVARACAGGEETCLVTVIIEEMGRGNFSFLILIVGLLQLFVMLRKR